MNNMDDLNLNGNSGEMQEMPADSSGTVIRKMESNLKSIHLSGNGFIIKEEAPIRSYESLRLADSGTDIPGAYFQGTQYYDLKNIYFISNAGMAALVELLESLIERDVDVQFVNVSEKIKNRIRELGLEHIIIWS